MPSEGTATSSTRSWGTFPLEAPARPLPLPAAASVLLVADDPSRWFFSGRHYAVTQFSDVATRDGYGWEVDDVAPAPGRGTVLEAFWDDTTGEFTFWSQTDEPLPFALVEPFVAEARRGVPPVT